MVFLQETEIDERGLRRLAASRSARIMRDGSEYVVQGVRMSDDEAWAVLSALPQTHTLSGKNVPLR